MTISNTSARNSIIALALAVVAVLTTAWLITSTGQAAAQGQGQSNSNGTPLVLADIVAMEIADQQRFDDKEAANQARFVAIDAANQNRFAALDQENQDRADALELLIETRVQQVKDDINNRADLMDDAMAEIDGLLFDTHLVNELDMEITACANLGASGGAEFTIEGETVGKGLGRLGALVYGNGGTGHGDALAKVAPALMEGGDVEVGLEACLGGITVRHDDPASAAADLRDAVDTLRTELGLTEDNAATALDGLINIEIPTDPFSVFTPGALTLAGSLPLPAQVASIMADPSSLVPSDMNALTPNCSNLPANALGDLLGEACIQVDGNIGTAAIQTIADIESDIAALASQLNDAQGNINAGVNSARDSVNGNIPPVETTLDGIQSTADAILTRANELPDS